MNPPLTATIDPARGMSIFDADGNLVTWAATWKDAAKLLCRTIADLDALKLRIKSHEQHIAAVAHDIQQLKDLSREVKDMAVLGTKRCYRLTIRQRLHILVTGRICVIPPGQPEAAK